MFLIYHDSRLLNPPICSVTVVTVLLHAEHADTLGHHYLYSHQVHAQA